MKFLSKAICWFSLQKPSTYATCYLIEFCQIVVTLSEIHFILPWSRSRTCFHHMLCFYTRSKQTSIHPQNKTPCLCMTPLSLKNTSRDMGQCKREKNNNKMHTQRRYATCFGMSKKKDSPYLKREKKERWFMQRSPYTIHQKYPHTLHILIKVFDLFLLWIRFLT